MLNKISVALVVMLVCVLVVQMDARTESRHGAPTPSLSPVPAEVAALAKGEEIWAPGQVETVTPEVAIQAQVTGQVESVHVKLGDWVQAGTLLIQIDDAEYRWNVQLAKAELQVAESQLQQARSGSRATEIQAARAELSAAESQLEHAQKVLNRNQYLAASETIPRSILETSQFEVRGLSAKKSAKKAVLDRMEVGFRAEVIETAVAGCSAALAKLRLAEISLKRTRVLAQVSGQILALDVHQGDVVRLGKPLMAIADTRDLRVRAWIDDLSALSVRVGANALVSAEGVSTREFVGEVSSVSPRMNPKQVKSYDTRFRADAWSREAWINLRNAEGLIPGMRVDVRVRR